MKTRMTKEMIIQALKKAVDDKKMVSKYLKGEISRNDLENKGIKLAKPL
ncbi:hypothetical protein [Sphingobacterium kyonggiense]